MYRFLIVICALALFTQCQHDVAEVLDTAVIAALERNSPTSSLDYYLLADPANYAALPNQDPHNPITAEKVALGQMLFFDPGLAQNPLKENCRETYSCSTCHVPESGFLPGRFQGIADGADAFGIDGSQRNQLPNYAEDELDAQGTRPLSPLNVAYVTNTLWSGLFGADAINVGTQYAWTTQLSEVNHLGYTGLESQNIEGFDLHRLEINDRVLDDFGYRDMFDTAFPEFTPEERYSEVAASFAIGAYLRTLITDRAPFQDWLKGDLDALTDNQKQGALLFFGKARCTNCHKSPSFSAMEFHVLGTKDMWEMGGLNTSEDDPRNLGRGMFTGRPQDMRKFKVPQLYNLKDYVTFFHGSSKRSVREVVDFKIRAKSENRHVPDTQLSAIFRPRDLTNEEVDQLVDFLENGLYDPAITRYAPTSVQSGLCFPNNDEASRQDLGCN